MQAAHVPRPGLALATALPVLLALVLAGCGSSSQRNVTPMMRGNAVPTNGSPWSGMMGGTGYHMSRLTCGAPASLSGRRVNVMLADMGTTRMMAGAARLGVQMTLQALPVRVRAGQVSLVAANVGWRTHELVLLPLATGAAAGRGDRRRRASRAGALPSRSAVGQCATRPVPGSQAQTARSTRAAASVRHPAAAPRAPGMALPRVAPAGSRLPSLPGAMSSSATSLTTMPTACIRSLM